MRADNPTSTPTSDPEMPLIPSRSGPAVAEFIVGVVLTLAAVDLAAADALPSWNDGAAKSAIIDFVDRVSEEGGPSYVPPAQRIATFDNDGTLWSEQPVYFQFAFVFHRIKVLAPQHPGWKTTQPFKAVLAGDMKTVLAGGEKSLMALMAATHAGMTTDEFAAAVADWCDNARHPRFQRPYTDLVYQPMLELLDYLRANGFKTFIVSGGGVEFMRVFAERVYGIPPEQVIGSSGALKFESRDGKPTLVKLPQVEFIDDRDGKPKGIQRFIGRRPILAFGNSDGDLQMLQWTAAGDGARFVGLVHHTDAQREWAYDRKSKIGTLDKARDEADARNWTVVDMQKDWKVIYPFEK